MFAVPHGPNTLLVARGMLPDELSAFLVRVTNHPIIDKASLTGTFDIHLEFLSEQPTPALPDLFPSDAPPEIPPAPALSTVLEQLGLKLVPTRGSREFVVIDHIERPSEN